MKKIKKTAEASIRVFETLKMLTVSDFSIKDIIRHFENIDPQNRIYTNEVILKYINTLRVFGFKFIKNKDKYVLLNMPINLDFNQSELESLVMLKKYAQEFPEKKVSTEVQEFLSDIEKRLSDKTRARARSLDSKFLDYSKLSFDKYKEKIIEFEKLCLEKQRVKVVYVDVNSIETLLIAEPQDIIYFGNKIYFSLYNPLNGQVQNLEAGSIKKIEQLPTKSSSMHMNANVTVRFKGRLAKAYNLKENEKLVELENDESIILMIQYEDLDLLLNRLMKYGELCEILTPKSLRRKMLDKIKNILALYK